MVRNMRGCYQGGQNRTGEQLQGHRRKCNRFRTIKGVPNLQHKIERGASRLVQDRVPLSVDGTTNVVCCRQLCHSTATDYYDY